VLELRLEALQGTFTLQVALRCGPGPTVVVGPNGAGKSMLLRAVLGAIPVRRGAIRLGPRVLFDSEERIDVPCEQRRIGWVPQEYALFPHLTVRQNVAFGVDQADGSGGSRVETLLEQLGLKGQQSRWPNQLSGGERQKVALARALAPTPEALLLDEPLAALDAQSREVTRSFLAQTLRSLAIPSLVVTHDPRDAEVLGGPLVILEGGRIRNDVKFP
jgi:molybdate transport system ATP-binding protein